MTSPLRLFRMLPAVLVAMGASALLHAEDIDIFAT